MFRVLYIAVYLLISTFSVLNAEPKHGVSYSGDLKYSKDFKNFDYVNPHAPKGGELVLHSIGSFDSLNPFIIRGTPAQGISVLYSSYIYATLLEPSADEPFTHYGYLAESVEVAHDHKSVTFMLRPEAVFEDGSSVTPEDVIYSFEMARTEGTPIYRTYYNDITKIEKIGTHGVKFHFRDAQNKELPLILGQMPIFSKKFYEKQDFTKPHLIPPLGNGPYRVAEVDPGRSITYERNPDWWGAKLPVNVGRYNPNRIRILYFRDSEVAFEGFKAGEYDFRVETSSKNWAERYNFKAVKDGFVQKKQFEIPPYFGMMAIAMNTRLPKFQDKRIRRAMAVLFDFVWVNKNILFDLYKARPTSFFNGSELAARDIPMGRELEILSKYKNKLPHQLFTHPHTLPATNGDGNIRNLIQEALDLFEEAGWKPDQGVMKNVKTGEAFDVSFTIVDPSQENMLQAYARNLEKVGVKSKIRQVEAAQYINKLSNFDFEMVLYVPAQSPSPGNEQREFWGSKAADMPSARNLPGIKDPVIDALIEHVIDSDSREELIDSCRALDRVLSWGEYVVPLVQHEYTRVAHWNNVRVPNIIPKYKLDTDAFWVEGKRGNELFKEREQDTYYSPNLIAIYFIIAFVIALLWRYHSRRRNNRK